MITPRTTRLLRTPGLRAFQRTIALAAHSSTPDALRDTLIVVSTSGAADQLRRTLEELWLVEQWRPSADECAALGLTLDDVTPGASAAAATQADAASGGVGRAGASGPFGGDSGGDGGGVRQRQVATGACIWPSIVTRAGLYRSLYERLDDVPWLLDDYAREVLFQRAAADAVARGDAPPFEVRPGLLPEMLGLYDALRRQHRSVDDFERLVGGALEAGAEIDHGARRLLQQTRFLVSAFRAYETRLTDGDALDEHGLRARLLERASARPIRRLIVTIPDQRADAAGLWPTDFDLLTRLAGLDAIDMVATEALLATGYIERLFETLPGIEVHVVPDVEAPAPLLLAPPLLTLASGRQDVLHFTSRDREQELADAVRRLGRAAMAPRSFVGTGQAATEGDSHDGPRPASLRVEPPAYDRMAVVYQRPLPYLYLARQVLGAYDVPWQAFDALPLAAEPYAAALDLVVTFAISGCTRAAGIALLRAPQFRFDVDGHEPTLGEIAACDAELRDVGFLGGRDRLRALLDDWRRDSVGPSIGTSTPQEIRPILAARPSQRESGDLADSARPRTGRAHAGGPHARGGGRLRSQAVRALAAMVAAADALQALDEPALQSAHLAILQQFLDTHARQPIVEGAWDQVAARQLRARAAVAGTMAGLRLAFTAHGEREGPFRDLAALVHRWLEGQTFNPRVGEHGLHLVDVQAAVYGRFSHLALVGVVEGEWPAASSRSIFYPASLLRDLGWPAETERRAAARAVFDDLLRLARDEVSVSVFALEHDAIVRPSPFVEDLTSASLPTARVTEAAGMGMSMSAAGMSTVDTSSAGASRVLASGVGPSISSPSASGPSTLAPSVPSASGMRAASLAASGVTISDRLLTVPALVVDPDEEAAWAALRRARSPIAGREFHGWTGTMAPRAYSVTGLDRYLQCPFRYFAGHVLRLEEEPERRPGLTPMERGRFEHEVFQVFFTRWDGAGRGAIDESSLDAARAEFLEVVADVLARLPPAERELERARLLGSAVSAGLGERVFRFEAARLAPIAERLLEYSLDGDYTLSVPVRDENDEDDEAAETKGGRDAGRASAAERAGRPGRGDGGARRADDAREGPASPVTGRDAHADEGEEAVGPTMRTRTIRLRGTADRIDLLADGTVRVIDYKTGKASSASSSIQLPVYAHCAEQRLAGHRGRQWRVSEAGYLAFGRPEPFVPVVAAGDDARKKVTQAVAKVVEVVDRIEEGAFPVTPVEPHNCIFCGFSAVCRKDYVEDL